MKYALLIVSQQKVNTTWPESMTHVLYKMSLPEGVRRMNESAWLVRLETDLLFLVRLTQIAIDSSLIHHILFFEEEPKFLSATPNATMK